MVGIPFIRVWRSSSWPSLPATWLGIHSRQSFLRFVQRLELLKSWRRDPVFAPLHRCHFLCCGIHTNHFHITIEWSDLPHGVLVDRYQYRFRNHVTCRFWESQLTPYSILYKFLCATERERKGVSTLASSAWHMYNETQHSQLTSRGLWIPIVKDLCTDSQNLGWCFRKYTCPTTAWAGENISAVAIWDGPTLDNLLVSELEGEYICPARRRVSFAYRNQTSRDDWIKWFLRPWKSKAKTDRRALPLETKSVPQNIQHL